MVWHLWVMGLIGAAFGAVLVADYAMVQYQMDCYLQMFTAEQQAWFTAMPKWVDGVWGAQVSFALLGGLFLLFRARPAVWMLGFSFIFNVVLTVWLLGIADPAMQSVTGWAGPAIMGLSVALSLLLWLYARGEKQDTSGCL